MHPNPAPVNTLWQLTSFLQPLLYPIQIDQQFSSRVVCEPSSTTLRLLIVLISTGCRGMLAMKMTVEILGSFEKQSVFIQMLLLLVLSIFKGISPYQRKGRVSIVRNNTHYIIFWYVTTAAAQRVVKEATFFIHLQINCLCCYRLKCIICKTK